MLVAEFIAFLLEDCLEEARYGRLCGQSDEMAWRGTGTALEECRTAVQGDRMADRLRDLLADARRCSSAAVSADAHDQWFWFAREATVEWIASVISVVLLQRREPTIVPPTRGAALAAAALVNGRPPQEG